MGKHFQTRRVIPIFAGKHDDEEFAVARCGTEDQVGEFKYQTHSLRAQANFWQVLAKHNMAPSEAQEIYIRLPSQTWATFDEWSMKAVRSQART